MVSELPTKSRLIVLGASNVTRGLVPLLHVARQTIGSPLDFVVAAGHGRSYNWETRVAIRRLCGILHCQLWEDLKTAPPSPTTALLTDIGNDILYGATPSQISSWVEECLARLAPHCDRLIVTQLPLSSFREVGQARFLAFRTLLFPFTRLQLGEALARAEEVNQRVSELAARYHARLVLPTRSWYGFDPIHVRPRFHEAAWRTILAPKENSDEGATNRFPREPFAPLHALRMLLLPPAARKLFGVSQHRAQPAARWNDGTTIALY